MKKTMKERMWISTALLNLLVLTACSDQTQFTERTISSLTGEKNSETDSTSGQIAVEGGSPSSDDLSRVELPSDAGAPLPEEKPNTEAEVNEDEAEDKGAEKPLSTSKEGDSAAQNAGQNGGGVLVPQTQPGLFQRCVDQPSHAIVARVYPLMVNTQNLPDFATLEPVGDEVCLSQLNITKRAFTEGFPGVNELIEWFGLDINFKVNVPTSGTYTLTLSSDDGSLLFIDGKPVIDNDGLHETRERSANVYLSAGQHNFHIKYFQGPRYHIALELFWKAPGASTRSYIPQNLISRP